MQKLLNVTKYVALGVLIVALAASPFMAFNAYADFDYTPEQWHSHVVENLDYYKSIGIPLETPGGGEAFVDSVLSDGLYFIISKYWYTLPFELTFEYSADEEAYFSMNISEWYVLSDGMFMNSLLLIFGHAGYDSNLTLILAGSEETGEPDLSIYGGIVIVPYNDISPDEPTVEPTTPDSTAPSSPPAGGDNGTFIQTVGNMLTSVMAWVGAVLTALFTASGAFNGLIVFIGIGTAVAFVLIVRKLVQKFRKQ